MLTKYWNFLRTTSGEPVESAKIDVYVYPLVGGAATYAYIYLTIDGSRTTTDLSSLLTDSNGYFEFYVADLEEDATYGYDFTNQFKITWSLAGVATGSIDKLQLFDVTNRPVDETASGVIKNKMVSDSQAKEWQDHIDNVLTRDDHTQYLLADGARILTGDWDVGSTRKIKADFISARNNTSILKLVDTSNRGVFVQPTGVVDILNVNIDGGTIDNVALGGSGVCTGVFSTGVFSIVDINSGTIDNVILGGNVACVGTFSAGTFSTIDIDGGTIENATIGLNVPASAAFLGISAITADLTNVYADNIIYSFGSITSTGLIGDWTCVGTFTADNVKIDGNTIYSTNDSGLSLLDNATNGIYINDGGYITIGPSGTPHEILTVIDTAAQLRLQFNEFNYSTLFTEANGGLIITSTGTSPMVYFEQNIDMEDNVLTAIGTGNSYFAADGSLVLKGTCSTQWSYQIDGRDVLSAPSTTHASNLLVGVGAGYNFAAGESNTVIGPSAAYNLTNGNNNTLIGYKAGENIDTGSNNILVGSNVGNALQSHLYNVFIGDESGYNNVGSRNVFIGHQAGYNTTSSGNVFIGYHAGYDVTGPALSGSNSLYIANWEDLYPLIYGSFSLNRIGLQTVEPQFTLDVHGDIRISDMHSLYFGGSHTIHPSAFVTYDGDEFIVSNTMNVSGSVYVMGDNSGKSNSLGLTNISNSTVSSGDGTIKMCGSTGRNSTGFIKVYVGADTRYIPYFTTITG